MRPPNIDFRFLFHTPKNIHLKGKNVLFLNAYKVKKKYQFPSESYASDE